MKKTINMLVICIVGLLITVSATAVVETRETIEQMNIDDPIVIIRNSDANTHTLATKGERLSDAFKPITLPLADVPVASTEDDEIHPTITKGAGKFFAGYANKLSILEQYIYMISSEDGITWEPLGFWNMEGIQDYPAFDHWGGNTFYGTFSPGEEGMQYLLETPDINDPEGMGLIFWDWSDDGWYDMKEMDIACHDSQNTWEYGFMSTVASTTYGEDQGWDGENMPHVFYRDPVEEGTGYISWNTYYGCAHSAICIDKTADMMYSVYDYYNETAGSWNLLLWKRSFEDPSEGYSEFIEIQSSFNVQYPAIAADNDNVMIVCHSDENTNTDLICYYSNDGGENWDSTYIANSPNDEQYPDMVSIAGTNAGCVFTLSNGLNYISTEDGGATWTDPVKLNDGDSVIEEYRTASVCVGSVVWADTRNGNPDIFYDVTGAFPEVSVKTISGGIGVSAEIENTGTADANNVQWSIDLEGGLVLIGAHADGTISTLAAGTSQTVKIGFVLGLGGVTITAVADSATKSATGTVLLFLVTGL